MNEIVQVAYGGGGPSDPEPIIWTILIVCAVIIILKEIIS